MGNTAEEAAREALEIPPSVRPAGAGDGVNMVGDTILGFKGLYLPALGRLVVAILQLPLPRPLSSLVFGFSCILNFTELKRPH